MSYSWEQKLAHNLHSARIGKGLSQSEVARITGLRPSAVSHFECSQRVPSLQNFQKLCAALHVKAEELLP
jgi:transcriptional regulator with XRE-family HTH domain